MPTTIIELKESKSTDDTAEPGVFSITLDTPLTISDGDQIAIKNIFVDSVESATNQIMVTPADQQIEIDVIKFMTSITNADALVTHGAATNAQIPPNSVSMPSGSRFAPRSIATNHNPPAGDESVSLQEVTIRPSKKWHVLKWAYWGAAGQGLTLKYMQRYNSTEFSTLTLPDFGTTGKHDSHGCKFNEAIAYYPKGGINDSGFYLDDSRAAKQLSRGPYYIDIDRASFTKGATVDFDTTLTPIIDTFRFKIPLPTSKEGLPQAKAFEPSRLCKIITDAMTQHNIHFDGVGIYDADLPPQPLKKRVIRSPFLASAYSLYQEGSAAAEYAQIRPGMRGAGGGRLMLVSADGAAAPSTGSPHGKLTMIQYNNIPNFDSTDFAGNEGPNPFIGASQVALEINDNGRAQFTLMHSFMIVTDNDKIGVKFTPRTTAGDGQNGFFPATSPAGIAITRLSPFSLWHGKLGFDESIYPTQTSVINDGGALAAPFDGKTLIPQFNFEVGKNVTSEYCGISSVVNLTKANFRTSQAIAGTGLEVVTHGVSTPLVASNSLNSADFREPYFLIDINGVGLQDMRGAGLESNRIQAVISRFYQTNSFTTAYNEGSLPYTHRGSPITLSAFNVSILGPNFEPAVDIGHNSTVFLQVDRAKQD